MSRFGLATFPIAVAVTFALSAALSTAQARSRALITQQIDETQLRTLAGNTRAQANAQNDRGRVPDGFAMEHMLLQLQRPAEQEQAVRQLIDQMHTPSSPAYHHWLTAAAFGEAYGVARQDIATVTEWLGTHGFTVNVVYPGGTLIDFSGTAGQVRAAFHTEVHNLEVNGQAHVANMSDPQIPAALAPAVRGVIAMHDFMPHTRRQPRAAFTFAQSGQTLQALTPADLATIYNLNPLFAAGNTGKGQTIAVIEDASLYNPADWTTFRTTFGLDPYTGGSLTEVHPQPAAGASNCGIPGLAGGDDGEAILDAEWASAAAPDAAIQVVACSSTRSTWGGMIALANLLNSANPPAVVSLSYGECEAGNGAAANAAFAAAYQQAVAEGISVFVSAGDEGAASCDAGASGATHGIGVSGYASTPYNVAVGGTDFGDSVAGTTGTYWSAANTATYGSALSYIPEIPWNDSCAGSLLAGYFGFTQIYGSNGFCGSSAARQNGLLAVAAGSGGPSGCATGTPSNSGVVGGTCQGYAKPAWQANVAGIPNDGVRDIPDVSLFAGDGIWGHFYVTCWSDVRNGGAPCTGDPSGWGGAGGTSFAAPIMAGIQALVNQKVGGPQGNPNYVYYSLAAGPAACDSSTGNAAASTCVFYNITEGDNAVNCVGGQNCYGAATGGRHGGGNGALSISTDSFAPAYSAGPGWNFAAGIGSVNAFNLVNSWPTGQ